MDLSSNPIRVPPIISETSIDILKETVFDWIHPKLKKYADKLAESTRLIKLVNKQNSKEFQYIKTESDPYGNLSEFIEKYNGEMISTTWVSFWEMFDKIFSPYFKEKRKQPMFNTFHLHEDDGVLFSLNHFISTMGLAWEWYAVSLNAETNIKNKKRWITVESSDSINSENIRLLMHRFENKPINFYTSNTSNTIKTLYGDIFCGLALLGTGGNMIVKCELTNAKTPMISILYLMSIVFNRFLIYVPHSDHNSTFLAGINYRGITSNNLKKLLDWYNVIDDDLLDRISIFKRTDIPVEFIDKAIRIIRKITELHVKINNRQLILYRDYKDKDMTEIVSDMEDVRKKQCKYWIEQYHLFKLDESKEIIRNQIRL
jgi:hypothetical protein